MRKIANILLTLPVIGGLLLNQLAPLASAQVGLEVTKDVSVSGQAFATSVVATPQDTLTFRIGVRNTTQNRLSSVVVSDTIAAGMTYQPGTTRLFVGSSTFTDREITAPVTVLNLDAGSNFFITYRAQINPSTPHNSQLSPAVRVSADGISVSVSPVITVNNPSVPSGPIPGARIGGGSASASSSASSSSSSAASAGQAGVNSGTSSSSSSTSSAAVSGNGAASSSGSSAAGGAAAASSPSGTASSADNSSSSTAASAGSGAAAASGAASSGAATATPAGAGAASGAASAASAAAGGAAASAGAAAASSAAAGAGSAAAAGAGAGTAAVAAVTPPPVVVPPPQPVAPPIPVAQPTPGFIVLQKDVRNLTRGEAAFFDSNLAFPGDLLEYRITYRNTGSGPVVGIRLTDILPSGTSFVSGTTAFTQTARPFERLTDGFTSGGILLPDLPVGHSAEITFWARTDTRLTIDAVLINLARLEAGSGQRAEDTAVTRIVAQLAQQPAPPVAGPAPGQPSPQVIVAPSPAAQVVRPISALPKTGVETLLLSLLLSAGLNAGYLALRRQQRFTDIVLA